MSARAPEEIPELLARAMNAGDLDAFVELHEPGASTIVPTDGSVATGESELRAAVEPILALGPILDNEVLARLESDGLALIHTRWGADGVGSRWAGRRAVRARHDRLPPAARRQLADLAREHAQPRVTRWSS